MNIGALFIALGGSVVVLWFILRQLTAKPWETQGEIATGATTALPPQRVALWVFLGVVTSLFGLFISAYSERMEVGDWVPVKEPGLLWLNTIVLILGSAGLQYARSAAAKGDALSVRRGLIAGGAMTWLFVIGQVLVWRELYEAGYFLVNNAAAAFFYLLTGLHALHLLGGLYVWARSVLKMFGKDKGASQLGSIGLSVQLCTVYWHYLLIVWLVLFGLLLST